MSNGVCQRCYAEQILSVTARAKDMHVYVLPDGSTLEGYAIWFSGDGDTTVIRICCSCGQVQGEFPLDLSYELES